MAMMKTLPRNAGLVSPSANSRKKIGVIKAPVEFIAKIAGVLVNA
jgi:hypothetical protein